MNQELHDYFKGDEAAIKVWTSKYQLKDKHGNELELTPDDMHQRLAKEFYKIEEYFAPTELTEFRKRGHVLSKYGQERGDLTEVIIYKLFEDFKYIIPQGSVMAQAGSPTIGSLSNCVVMDSPKDSYGGIMYTDQQLAQLYKRRCGVGIDISTLRPKNAATSNAAKSSTGAVSFMDRFSNTTREVAQNGRRGALMLTIDVRHPDAIDFVTIKQDLTKITGANISVKTNNEFMEAAINDEDYYQVFPCDTPEVDWSESVPEYNQTYTFTYGDGEPTIFVRKIKAKELWDTIVQCARDTAEPGILNWDHMVDYSPDSAYPQYIQKSTNPCSEIGMQAGDSCRLIAINLLSFVRNPYTKEAYFDFGKFYEVVYEATRLSDNLVEMELRAVEKILAKIEQDPEPEHIKAVERATWELLYKTGAETRRIGLGITALADCLAAMGYKYDSDWALKTIEAIFETKMRSEFDCSTDLSILRGSFQTWDVDREFLVEGGGIFEGKNPFYQFLLDEFPEQAQRMVAFGRRNLSLSTCAPTGSLSMLAQTSSGIEPVFLLKYTRRIKVNPGDEGARVDFVDDNGDTFQEEPVLHHQFKEWIKVHNRVNELGLNVDNLNSDQVDALYKISPWYEATAPDIDWIRRVEIQATIQKYVTHSISSTINLPTDVTTKEVGEIYVEAWRQGVKGITVYRDGARDGILVSDTKPKTSKFDENHAPPRPKKVPAKLLRFNNNKEKWIAFVGMLDGRPYEVFTCKLESVDLPNKVDFGEIVKVKDEDGRKRYDFHYDGGIFEGISRVTSRDFWNYGKLFSGMLRHGMPLVYVVDTISNLSFEEDHINTWKNGVVRALRKCIKSGAAADRQCKNPECGDPEGLVYEEGCLKCKSCGDTKCG